MNDPTEDDLRRLVRGVVTPIAEDEELDGADRLLKAMEEEGGAS